MLIRAWLCSCATYAALQQLVERLVCTVLVNSNSLTGNFGFKQISLQNQLQNPRASNLEESNEVFDRAVRGWLL